MAANAPDYDCGHPDGPALPILREALRGSRDRSHIWGEYVEAMLDSSTVLREIVVYPSGRTSIHRHRWQSELVIVAAGAVEVALGWRPADLDRRALGTGAVCHVPPGMYHGLRFAGPAARTQQPWARVFEVVLGFDSADDIERYAPATAGQRPGPGVDPLATSVIQDVGWPA